MNLRTTILTLAMAALVLATGCDTVAPAKLHFYRNDAAMAGVSRVVFVNLAENCGYPEIAARMTRSLSEAMISRGQFRVDVISATHPDLRDLNMIKREPYTIAELVAIRKSLRCDAILFGRMSSYRPYPGQQVGLFLRLVDLKDGRLIWAADDVWDSTNRKTVKRIKTFYFDHMRDTYQPVTDDIGYQSTSGFQKFVSWEVVNTMDVNYEGESSSITYFYRPMRRVGRHLEKTSKNTLRDY